MIGIRDQDFQHPADGAPLVPLWSSVMGVHPASRVAWLSCAVAVIVYALALGIAIVKV
jgi:hypothetical protein